MNPLRQAIETELSVAMHDASSQASTMLFGFEFEASKDYVNAILDAVIAALPEERQKAYILEGGATTTEEGNQRFHRYGGHDSALNNVRRILTAAKDNQ